MKNKHRYYELISYRKSHLGEGDFNGPESALSLEEQIDYLKVFAQDYSSFANAKLDQEEVKEEELTKWKGKIAPQENEFRARIYLKGFEAHSKVEGEYEHLHLFTSRAQACGKRVKLIGQGSYPSSGFLLEFASSVSKMDLKLRISEDFSTPLRGEKTVTTMGKVLEFRSGIQEIIRLQFYSDGSLDARLLEKDAYHYSNHAIARFPFGEDFDLCLSFSSDKVEIRAQGKRMSFPCHGLPNVLMASSGFYPMGDMEVELSRVYGENGKEMDPFEKREKKQERNLGKVDLPFGIGGAKHACETLHLTKKFDYRSNGRSLFLHLSCLDPCGEVLFNGKNFPCPDFLSQDLDLTPYAKEGENELELIIEPRCSENFCTWHRGKDPYYGWFAGEAYLEERSQEAHLAFAKIQTIENSRALRSLDLVSDSDKGAIIEIYCDGSSCSKKEFALKKGNTHLEYEVDFKASLWSPEEPNLHEIQIDIIQKRRKVDSFCLNYGFRTIEQKNGELRLNGNPYVLKGALIMQYPWPIEELPLLHLCPTDETILKEALKAKAMNCNTVRMHVLGYGNAEERYARIFDSIGLNVIWTTRFIDSLGTCMWDPSWRQREGYIHQIKDVINHPSILIYEGLNEQGLYQQDIDSAYRAFLSLKKVDPTRLLSPISHLYYAADSYDLGCFYYQDDGKKDHFGKQVQADPSWNDPCIVRSSHAYNWLLGYGSGWDRLRKQDWSGYLDLLKSEKTAFLVSEYAIIGRANPNTPKTKVFFNPDSYEYGDEERLGYHFKQNFLLSQAYQALAAKSATKKMLGDGVDGLLWCALSSGANEGSYLKPLFDYQGCPKLSFYALRETFQNAVCFDSSTDIVWGENHMLHPLLCGCPDGKIYRIEIRVESLSGEALFRTLLGPVKLDRSVVKLEAKEMPNLQDGYYRIVYEVSEA